MSGIQNGITIKNNTLPIDRIKELDLIPFFENLLGVYIVQEQVSLTNFSKPSHFPSYPNFTLQAGQRFLLVNQFDTNENGVYEFDGTDLIRRYEWKDITSGNSISVANNTITFLTSNDAANLIKFDGSFNSLVRISPAAHPALYKDLNGNIMFDANLLGGGGGGLVELTDILPPYIKSLSKDINNSYQGIEAPITFDITGIYFRHDSTIRITDAVTNIVAAEFSPASTTTDIFTDIANQVLTSVQNFLSNTVGTKQFKLNVMNGFTPSYDANTLDQFTLFEHETLAVPAFEILSVNYSGSWRLGQSKQVDITVTNIPALIVDPYTINEIQDADKTSYSLTNTTADGVLTVTVTPTQLGDSDYRFNVVSGAFTTINFAQVLVTSLIWEMLTATYHVATPEFNRIYTGSTYPVTITLDASGEPLVDDYYAIVETNDYQQITSMSDATTDGTATFNFRPIHLGVAANFTYRITSGSYQTTNSFTTQFYFQHAGTAALDYYSTSTSATFANGMIISYGNHARITRTCGSSGYLLFPATTDDRLIVGFSYNPNATQLSDCINIDGTYLAITINNNSGDTGVFLDAYVVDRLDFYTRVNGGGDVLVKSNIPNTIFDYPIYGVLISTNGVPITTQLGGSAVTLLANWYRPFLLSSATYQGTTGFGDNNTDLRWFLNSDYPVSFTVDHGGEIVIQDYSAAVVNSTEFQYTTTTDGTPDTTGVINLHPLKIGLNRSVEYYILSGLRRTTNTLTKQVAKVYGGTYPTDYLTVNTNIGFGSGLTKHDATNAHVDKKVGLDGSFHCLTRNGIITNFTIGFSHNPTATQQTDCINVGGTYLTYDISTNNQEVEFAIRFLISGSSLKFQAYDNVAFGGWGDIVASVPNTVFDSPIYAVLLGNGFDIQAQLSVSDPSYLRQNWYN